jgi:hypothetical protein
MTALTAEQNVWGRCHLLSGHLSIAASVHYLLSGTMGLEPSSPWLLE